jgi:hypothetical protein
MPVTAWFPAPGLAAYRDGVTVICELATQFGLQAWDTVVTVGGMAGAACVEWHLHAWDLARALGKEYRPANPEIVLAGGRAGAPQLPLGDDFGTDDPWLVLLRASGRSPD